MDTTPIFGFLPLTVVVCFAIPWLIAWIRVFGRIGWPPWLGVLMVIPLVNFVVFLVFGFKQWPIENRLRQAAGPNDRLPT